MNKKQILLLSTVCLLLLSTPLFAKENALSLGGKSGWKNLSLEKNVTIGSGRFGYNAIKLATNARTVTPSTDLLLSFEDNRESDLSEQYSIVSSKILYTEKAKMGKRAALSKGGNGGIKLRGNPGTLFGTEGRAGSFTIEFWLMPSLCANGETIFTWRSSKNVGGRPLVQLITSSFTANHIEWNFTNIFFDNETSREVKLISNETILPDEWSHHSLIYDDETGLLEYFINGRTEAILYVTKNNREGSTILSAEIGVPANIELAPFFTGCIDDFRILRSVSQPNRNYYMYDTAGGRFESEPIATTGIGSKMTSISAVIQQPPQTDVQFYVRAGENMFDWTADYPVWTPVKLDSEIRNINGRYFQIAADLYTDGLGSTTPSITEIIVHYQEKRLPVPPYSVFAQGTEGAVELNWVPTADGSAKGYMVYYGETPGEYLGQIAVEGFSPINVKQQTSIRITGLENGKIYYFAVAAYGDLDADSIGALSHEVYARPSRNLQ